MEADEHKERRAEPVNMANKSYVVWLKEEFGKRF